MSLTLCISLYPKNNTFILADVYHDSLANTIQMHMSRLRDKTSSMETFRKSAQLLSHLLALETTAHLPMARYTIETPCGFAQACKPACNVILVPIWRSGDELYVTFMKHFEQAKIGFVGMRRNETTAQAEFYYANIPSIHENDIAIILDPMIATGGSAAAAIELIKQKGIPEQQIIFVGFIAAPEGLRFLQERYPNITIITAVLDERLNEHKFIVPGLGDFGDRYFGTIHE
jgi:uracil phosphoribosyltransferase